MTPVDEIPAYSQRLPTPINLKEDVRVELSSLHKHGIITTLPFSKNASRIFAQRKPKSKLGLLLDLRKTNNLISGDYINKNNPVSTLTDSAQDMTGKNYFANLINSKHTTAYKWQTRDPCLTWPVEPSHIEL